MLRVAKLAKAAKVRSGAIGMKGIFYTNNDIELEINFHYINHEQINKT